MSSFSNSSPASQPSSSPSFRPWQSGLFLAASLALVCASGFLTCKVDPWKENLTGLGWVHGHVWLMSLWTLAACVLNASLMAALLKARHETKKAAWTILFWTAGGLGTLLPYIAFPHSCMESLLTGQHLLLCSGSFVCIVALWLYFLLFPCPDRLLIQAAWCVAGSAALAAAAMAYGQTISLVCELVFLDLCPLLLSLLMVKESRKARKKTGHYSSGSSSR